MTILNSLPPYVLPGFPVPNVTPFTYRDGYTFLERQEDFIRWINKVVLPWMNENYDKLGETFVTQVQLLINSVNEALTEQSDEVDGKITNLTTYVNQQVALIIEDGIQVQDPVVAGILDNLNSLGYAAMAEQIVRLQGNVVYIPTGTSTQVQNKLNTLNEGDRAVFGPGTYTAPTNGFTLPHDFITVDTSRANMRSSTWGRPLFDLLDRNDITLFLGLCEYTGTRGPMGATYRGSANYVSTAAVWSNGSRIRVESLHSKNYVTGVFFTSWNGTILNGKYNYDNFIGTMEVEGYDFGTLFTGQRNLVIVDIYGHDDIDDSGGVNPTHVIYGSSTTGWRDTNVTIHSARAVRNLNGHAFQLKYSDNATIGMAEADDCAGIISIIDCNDLTIQGFKTTKDKGFTNLGSVTFQSTNTVSQRPRINSGSIELATNANVRGLLFIADDGVIDNLTVLTNYDAGGTNVQGVIDNRGNRNEINARVINKVAPFPAVVIGTNAPISAGATINVIARNATVVVQMFAGVTGVKLGLDPNLQTYTTALVVAAAGVDWSNRAVEAASISTLGENASLNLVAKDSPNHPVANLGVQVKVRPTRDMSITNVYWWSVTSGGNYDIAVYDDASGARLWSKGSTPWPSAGLINETVASPFIIRAGKTYRISISSDSTTGAYRGILAATGGLDRLYDNGTNVTRVSAVFPLPSSLVAGATVEATLPLIVLAGVRP